MNEAKKAHLVSQAGTWSWRSASSWQPRAFIQWKVTGTSTKAGLQQKETDTIDKRKTNDTWNMPVQFPIDLQNI